MQAQSANGKCMKMHASLKHYTAYSIEANRDGIDEIISSYDLHDTYLPQYEAAFVQGKAGGAMCSYNSVNGDPMCGNGALLNKQIRGAWNRTDALIVTDCGAVEYMVTSLTPASRRLKHLVEATALSINSGVDLETGPVWTGDPVYGTKHPQIPKGDLADAVAAGTVTMATIDRALARSLTARMKLGIFDPLENCGEFAKLSIEDIGSKNVAHAAALASAAAQSFVLLRNQNHTLPLKAGTHIAVVGPHAVTRAGLLSDYAGDSWCWAPTYDGRHKNASCIPTIAESITAANAAGKTVTVAGVPVNQPCAMLGPDQGCQIDEAVAAAEQADVVLLCLGTTAQNDPDSTMGEGRDRASIDLPGSQVQLADAVLATGRPVVLVLVNGGVVAIDRYVTKAAAIVEAFLPSLQSPVLASTLFGRLNRWGKLPVTYYASPLPWNMTDMRVASGAGRTYRYFKGGALFNFGDGLSYTSFEHLCSCGPGAPAPAPAPSATTTAAMRWLCSCDLRNVGATTGDEVIMVYDALSDQVRAAVGAAHPVPIRRLVDFQRGSLAAGASATIQFSITSEMLQLKTADGSSKSYAGVHNLVFSRGNGNDQIVPITLV
jgi:beta-glucosidase-like glycosyl hydrolase